MMRRNRVRRTGLAILKSLVGAGPEAVKDIPVVGKAPGKVLSDIAEPVLNRIAIAQTQDRRQFALKKLFGTIGSTLVLPGTQHAQYPLLEGEKGYPSDMNAGKAIRRRLFPNIDLEEVSEPFPEPLAGTSLICLCSPVANLLARDYLGNPSSSVRNVIKEVIRPDYSAELVYNYVAPARNAPLIKNHQSGRDLPWEERNWSIMAPNGPLTPRHDDNGFLDMDYLLITRLPSGAVGVGDVILIGGTHGSGTQAIDLFLEKLPLEKVEEIVDKLSGSDYYQVLLEVRDITHEDRHSTGHDIRLVDCHSLKVVYN